MRDIKSKYLQLKNTRPLIKKYLINLETNRQIQYKKQIIQKNTSPLIKKDMKNFKRGNPASCPHFLSNLQASSS